MKEYTITRRDVWDDVENWELTPAELFANPNPDELAEELPELLKSREAEDGVPLWRVIEWYIEAAKIKALRMCDEPEWYDMLKMEDDVWALWNFCSSIFGTNDGLSMYLDDLDELLR